MRAKLGAVLDDLRLLETDTEYRRLERDLRANPDDPALRLAFDQARRRAGELVFPWRDRQGMVSALVAALKPLVQQYGTRGADSSALVSEQRIRELLARDRNFAPLPLEIEALGNVGENRPGFRLVFGDGENRIMFRVVFPVALELDSMARRGLPYVTKIGVTGVNDQDPAWRPLWRTNTREESDLESFLAGGKWATPSAIKNTLKKRKFVRVPDSELDEPRTRPQLKVKTTRVGDIGSGSRWVAYLNKTADGRFVAHFRTKSAVDEYWMGPK